MTGIDISKYQPAIPNGTWDFIICRATHDKDQVDPLGEAHFKAALQRAPLRGVYHYANPSESDGATQARLMAVNAIAWGFRKNIDLWALDSETGMSASNKTQNAAWVESFMTTARALLGSRGLWYVGWPYYVEMFGADTHLLRQYTWWLPAYGPNDGKPHTPAAPYLPVLHQYTSRGGPGGAGLDVSRVLDELGWRRLTTVVPPAPKPLPPPAQLTPRIKATHPPVDVRMIDGHPVILTSDGGVFAPDGGFYGTPVGMPQWAGHSAVALAVPGDPHYPLTPAEVAAKKKYAVVDSHGDHFAFGPK